MIILMSYSILSSIIIIYLYNFYNIFNISLIYYNIQIIFHNVSFFINVFKNDDYKHLCLSEKIISSIFVSIYIIIYISLKSTIILIDLALYSYCSLFIVLPIKTLIFILKRINKFIRDFILNHDEDNNEYVYIYENIITDTLHSYIIIVIIIINSIIRITSIIYTILSIITNGIIRITNGIIRITNDIIRITNDIININKIIEQNKKLLYINENQNKIINDLETLHYSPKLLEIRNNIINELKKELEEKNKCSICFNNTISHCCNPCGHTYCSDCIDKTNNCYICRGIIHNKIKLYL